MNVSINIEVYDCISVKDVVYFMELVPCEEVLLFELLSQTTPKFDYLTIVEDRGPPFEDRFLRHIERLYC